MRLGKVKIKKVEILMCHEWQRDVTNFDFRIHKMLIIKFALFGQGMYGFIKRFI